MWHLNVLTEHSTSLRHHTMELILVGILAILVAFYFFKHRDGRKLPPGPMGLPIFGYYLFLLKNPMIKLHEVAKKYGNIFSLYLGPQYIVMLDDWEATKEALNKTSTLDKPDALFSQAPYKLGIGGTNGPEWVQTRCLTSKAIKDIGLNRAGWEDLLQEDAQELVSRIMKEREKPVEVNGFFAETFVNNVASLILGERLNAENPLRKELTKGVNAISEFSPILDMINFSPTLSKLLQDLGIERKNLLAENVTEFVKYVSDTVDDKIRNPIKGAEEDSFIGRFQQEIENHTKDESSYFTVNSLKGNAIVLLTGGGETTRTTIIWALIAMADHPEKQQKVHEELDSVIGKEGVIKWGDQFKVPYTYASLLESMRWKTVVPLVMRSATEDTQIQGYHISKGTPIVFNNWSIHNDPKYWKTPEQFIPERFLLEDGQKVNSSPESFNPFSLGKRNCPGKLLALKASLLIFVILMQKFKVKPKNGKKVEYDTVLGVSYQARNVELRFIPR